MAAFLYTDVYILCTCGSLRPITKLYFCRHCVMLRCGFCVSHEVDSIYCSNCLENLASSEAKLKKNRCGTCFECPSCFHTLSIRATVTRNTGGEGSTQASKVSKSYYLACFFCLWTSRDVNIPDQQNATSSNWPEFENPHTSRINNLIEYYKVVSLRERLEKEKKVFYTPRRGYQHFTEKFGLTAMIARKRAGLPQFGVSRDDVSSLPELKPSVSSENVEQLPDDIFTKPVDIRTATNLKQRYVIPDLQPETIHDLFPVHKHLFSKRNYRCRSCSHNIFKPDYSPGSIKFKIYLAALYYIPEIRLLKRVVLPPGKETEVFIKLSNPSQTQTTVQLLQASEMVCIEPEIIEDVPSESDVDRRSYSSITVSKKKFPLEAPRKVDTNINADVLLPDITIILPPRDDTAEYDDNSDSGQYQDDPKVVIWRKGNKVALRLLVTTSTNVSHGDEVWICFVMRFLYKNKLTAALEQKEEKNVSVDVKYFINVGTLQS